MHPAIRKDGVAVVTGAAVGIGYAIARRLAQEEMRLVLFDRDTSALDLAVQRLRSELPALSLRTVVGDVTSATSQQELYEEATDFGDVSVLVNNAAIHESGGPWANLAQWRRVMEVNFWSILGLQQLFVARLMAQPSTSAIVNVGSKEGITTPPGNAAYSVSKAAVRVLTEQLAHELRERVQDRITAHLLIPGYTFTPMNFPGMSPDSPKPDAPWSADQVADRMVERMSAGDFYLFCEDNEVNKEMDQRRLQWSADDLIHNRPALSRWHTAYRAQFAAYLHPVAQDNDSGLNSEP